MLYYRLLAEAFKENFIPGMTLPTVVLQYSVVDAIFVFACFLFDESWNERTFYLDLVYINAPKCKLAHARLSNVNHWCRIVLIGCENSSI